MLAAQERPGKTIPTGGTHKAERERRRGAALTSGAQCAETERERCGGREAPTGLAHLSTRERGGGGAGLRGKGNEPGIKVGGPPEIKSLFLLFKIDKFK